MDDTGNVVFPAPEAGFIEIAGEGYQSPDRNYPNDPKKVITRISPTHRVWYSFQPAVVDPSKGIAPATAPLAVMFNGGPGTNTSALLFSFNTSTWTLDPVQTSSAASNPFNWTQFANLLYIDAPVTGFSYPLVYNNVKQDIGIDIDRDAGIFLEVIVRFLHRHPALLHNRVILAGESYGGIRATLMLNYLYNYQALSNGVYQDSQLSSDLSTYFGEALNTQTPQSNDIATRFGHQILMSPVVAGYDQYDAPRRVPLPSGEAGRGDWSNWKPTGCVAPADSRQPACYITVGIPVPGTTPTQYSYINPNCDVYNCDKSDPQQSSESYWSTVQMTTAAHQLNVVSTLSQVLGVNAKTIAWMYASARTNAYGRNNSQTVSYSTTDMINTFSTSQSSLQSDDAYFVRDNTGVLLGYGYQSSNPSRQWDDAPTTGNLSTDTGIAVGSDFVNNLHSGVQTFITVTQYDGVVRTQAIQDALNDGNFSSLVSNASYSSTQSVISGSPGGMHISGPSGMWDVAMPYYTSGHTVVMRTPGQLLADVIKWYLSTPH